MNQRRGEREQTGGTSAGGTNRPDVSDRGGQQAQRGGEDGGGRDETRARDESRGRFSDARDPQEFVAAYGDYGQPGREGRQGYGDMGMRGRDGGATQREGRGEARGRAWRRSQLCARDVMTRKPYTARPSDSLDVVAKLMTEENIGIVPIVEDGRLRGVITDRDIVTQVIASGRDVRNTRASEVMSTDLECVTEDESLEDVLRLMAEHQVRRIPIVGRDDRLVGIISMADIAREADVNEELQDTFMDISSERRFWSNLR